MTDQEKAAEYLNDYFGVSQLIVEHMADQAMDAILNFDNYSDIPEKSSEWTFAVAMAIFETALKLVPGAKALQLAFQVVKGVQTASEWVEKANKMAKEVGVDLFKDGDKPDLKEPPTETHKEFAVSMRDKVAAWKTDATARLQALRKMMKKLLEALSEKANLKNKKSLLARGLLKQTLEGMLGPEPVYPEGQIKEFRKQYELSLYKQYYAPGAYILRSVTQIRPGQETYTDEVKKVSKAILGRMKELTKLPTELATVATWNLPIHQQVVSRCNYCHEKPGVGGKKDGLWDVDDPRWGDWEPIGIRPKNDIDWRLRQLPATPGR